MKKRLSNFSPVMKCASFEARYETMLATSSGFPMYPKTDNFFS
jgi:hypothetical protein